MLGGTRFVGRAVVEAALARGWQVTVVSRGESGAPPPGANWLRVDRTAPGALQAAGLDAQDWDAVVDTWSGAAGVVRDSVSLLADRAAWYGFVSSRSVYRWPLPVGSDESAPVVDPDGEPGYAGDKRGAEVAVAEHFAGRRLIARAGLILGPYEDTGRLTWWLQRAALGGGLVAPEPPDQPWQAIDARDLAEFLLDAAASSRKGTYNVVGPRAAGITTERLLQACVAATGNRSTLAWVSPELLARARVAEWDGLPGWVPPGSEAAGMHDCDVSAAVAAGLRCRPIEATVADTWAWLQSLDNPYQDLARKGLPRRGLTAEQEQAIWWLRGNDLSGD